MGMTLALLAWIGHTAILVYSLNWWYGNAVPRKLLTAIRYLHGGLVIAFPIAIWRCQGLDLRSMFGQSKWFPIAWLLFAYVSVCWFVACVWLPAVTIGRLMRRPAALRSKSGQVVDIALELGYRPAGKTGHRYMTYWPGNQAFQVEFSEKTLRLARLPRPWHGLSILHLSDFHWTGSPGREFFERVMDRCRDPLPDLVVLTGDLIDSPLHHRWIIPLIGRLRWREGALGIMGNHESWYEPRLVDARLRRLGVQMVGGRWTQLTIRGLPLVVIGHEGPWFPQRPDLRDCPEGPFRLCLSHTPDNIRWARRHGVDLMLSGHNHGGQIRFPIFGSVLVPSRYSRRYDAGVFDERPTVLHVTRGLGGQHPLRYHCRPEAARLILECGSG